MLTTNEIKLVSNGYFQSLGEVVKKFLETNELKEKYFKRFKETDNNMDWNAYIRMKKELTRLNQTYFV